jgi:transcription elongation GreA/GreB family factor
MNDTQTVIQLSLAVDLIRRRRKTLKFLSHCSGSAYRTEVREELARAESLIANLQERLRQATSLASVPQST